MEKYSFLNALHPKLIEELYQKYIHLPECLDPSWMAFFQGFDFGTAHSISSSVFENNIFKEFQVISLIEAYRSIGHIFSITNPIISKHTDINLDIEEFGLSSGDQTKVFQAAKLLNKKPCTLSTILDSLKATYCKSLGIEYLHINSPERIAWIQNRINKNDNHPSISRENKLNLLKKLNETIVFENYLHTKFAGKKIFSIEGNETLLPAIEELLEYASVTYSVEELVVGMAHRGRINVLANIFKKDLSEMFSEFNSNEYEEIGFAGDVKYHLGVTTIRNNSKGKIVRMILSPNPSHLESVNSVVEGIARANIDHSFCGNYKKLLPILIHGDAAISGQGIIYEIVQMSQLFGYHSGGTIHIIVNNQIGFTTNYTDGRSSSYCTDVAKVILSPVLHINGDDVEAVIHAIHIAVDFRLHFKQDVFIDLIGYRKYGHNEGDEPNFTQPTLYKRISNHPNAKDIYKKKLDNEQIREINLIQNEDFRNKLELVYEISHSRECNKIDYFLNDEWINLHRPNPDILFQKIDTSFSIDKLYEIGKKITSLPKELTFYIKTKKLFNKRIEMIEKGLSIDWGMAELLAYGSLLYEGFEVRLSGEDVERGTFSHRHAIVKTENKEEKYIPLNHINRKQTFLAIYNSPLSEYGVMGFDYGYALSSPKTLTIWESQFGDFSNGAQIIIDQYISAAEDKWKMQNGLVIFLPHGYEGQGPDHSSGRIERFLQLCGRDNMCIINCINPSNFYHALRRQIKWSFRKPLIVFTPKSLLRHPFCICSLEDLAIGCFQPIIDDHNSSSKEVTKLVFCSGKIFYELFERRENIKAHHIALIRLEQLYPINTKSIENILIKYDTYDKLLWVQEEPANMGAWPYISRTKFDFELIARLESASSSCGSYHNFIRTQEEILDRVFK
ncbi:2-oxoglutarate dehydrogenase (succinyl-transferring), E1 component [Candidatus Uzinura diaspidicola str. ASNER]|uniref:oxoglutarate dehydrogenase (succinyl-transferring) n=1 Tax=Candidatus Uzinura diaspidicola str. ASNER TaxID=1133592 RepID=L7VGA1_9FLAO|nr:2-oxoglutarate dehydrogenase (succinyl-transferring), E1 component [Candidatus Uzinura diaspidicola str. ASNER]